MLNAETGRGQVLFQSDDFEEEDDPESGVVDFVPCVDEGELLTAFCAAKCSITAGGMLVDVMGGIGMNFCGGGNYSAASACARARAAATPAGSAAIAARNARATGSGSNS